ncbi:hypothetical protein V2G26_009390 [Clonostachys chloroleuca]
MACSVLPSSWVLFFEAITYLFLVLGAISPKTRLYPILFGSIKREQINSLFQFLRLQDILEKFTRDGSRGQVDLRTIDRGYWYFLPQEAKKNIRY